jgi:hypothetical protein
VTGVVPNGKSDPGAWVLVRLESEQLSLAIGGVQVTVASQDAFAETEMFGGHPVMIGSRLSLTVTLKLQVDTLPALSVAV